MLKRRLLRLKRVTSSTVYTAEVNNLASSLSDCPRFYDIEMGPCGPYTLEVPSCTGKQAAVLLFGPLVAAIQRHNDQLLCHVTRYLGPDDVLAQYQLEAGVHGSSQVPEDHLCLRIGPIMYNPAEQKEARVRHTALGRGLRLEEIVSARVQEYHR